MSIEKKFPLLLADYQDYELINFVMPDTYFGMRTDVALSEIIADLSRNRLTNWLKYGHILINNQIAKPKEKITGGETVTITPQIGDIDKAYAEENIDINVVYEDEQVIIINKPANLIVHPGSGNWSGTLLNGLLFHYPELKEIPRAGIVHRLDKDTTGLMVIARTSLAQNSLVQQLQARTVNRVYRAIVEGHPHKEGMINKNIGRDNNNRTKMTTLEFGGREAITRFKVLQQFEKLSYVECKLETGRTHQIRVHFKSIGHSLVSDPVYGTNKINYEPEVVEAINLLNRQALHALKLSFIHPTTNIQRNFKIKLADDFAYLLNTLQNVENLITTDDAWDNEEDDSNWEIIYAK